MMSLNLQDVWIITNYPVFRAAMQLPLSGGFNHITKENIRKIFNVPSGMLPNEAARDPKNYIYRSHGN
jgi:hypothetical protein